MKDTAVDVEVAGAAEQRVGVDLAFLKTRGRGHHLEGRSRRVLTGDGSVQERTVRVVEQAAVIRLAEPVGEEVGVVAGNAHNRQYLSGSRIDYDRRACRLAVANQSLRELLRGRALQVRVEGEIHGISSDGRLQADGPHDLAPRVDLDVSPTIQASKRGLEAGFDSNFADHLSRLIAKRAQALEVGVVQRSHVADHVTENHRVDVAPDSASHDRRPRKV